MDLGNNPKANGDKSMNNQEILINAINEDAGYKFINDNDQETRDQIVTTRDTVEGFKECQNHTKTVKTSFGVLEIFEVGNFELYVMDFGDHRFTLKDS